MSIFFYSMIFVFGLMVGSFLNCLIYRLEVGKSFLTGRSYCPDCKHILNWQDLIPVFSFLILQGKCRYCQKPISIQYPLVELVTGILFVLIFQHSIYDLRFVIYELIISCFLIVIFIFDLKHYIIPDEVIYSAILVSSIWYLVSGVFFHQYTQYFIINTIYSAVGAATFFGAIVLVSRGKWMGIGDIKLAFFMGLFLGFPKILVALFLAFFVGAIVGLILITLGKKTLKSEIPFGPFLVLGTFLAIFFGEKIIDFYLNLFLLK